MAQVTSGAETWVPHTHRHHHSGGTAWLFGPDGPTNVTGVDPVTVPAAIGSYELLFLARRSPARGRARWCNTVCTRRCCTSRSSS